MVRKLYRFHQISCSQRGGGGSSNLLGSTNKNATTLVVAFLLSNQTKGQAL